MTFILFDLKPEGVKFYAGHKLVPLTSCIPLPLQGHIRVPLTASISNQGNSSVVLITWNWYVKKIKPVYLTGFLKVNIFLKWKKFTDLIYVTVCAFDQFVLFAFFLEISDSGDCVKVGTPCKNNSCKAVSIHRWLVLTGAVWQLTSWDRITGKFSHIYWLKIDTTCFRLIFFVRI